MTLGPIDPFRNQGAPRARSACVVVGATPDQVAAVKVTDEMTIRANRLGTLVLGRLGSLPLDYAERFDGPVYDILCNPTTGWFVVMIFEGFEPPRRFELGATGETAGGYTRIADVLGATTAEAILDALDVPREVIG
jgi:hypothetical protein